MESDPLFQTQLQNALTDIGPEILSYNADEYWMIQQPYEYIEYYARERQFLNTCIALPLSRGLHDGSYRKSLLHKNNKSYKVPYVIHCLMVCRLLVDLHLPLPAEEEDIVLASALCHDVIEDVDLPLHGREMVTLFHLDERVYETVKRLSKRKDFTDEEHQAYFDGIQKDRFAILIKLSDRGNNVEDLYNMSLWKAHEYVNETRTFFYPMCDYALAHYEQLRSPLSVLQRKIRLLTEMTEILVTRYENRESELEAELKVLQEENLRLRNIAASLSH